MSSDTASTGNHEANTDPNAGHLSAKLRPDLPMHRPAKTGGLCYEQQIDAGHGGMRKINEAATTEAGLCGRLPSWCTEQGHQTQLWHPQGCGRAKFDPTAAVQLAHGTAKSDHRMTSPQRSIFCLEGRLLVHPGLQFPQDIRHQTVLFWMCKETFFQKPFDNFVHNL